MDRLQEEPDSIPSVNRAGFSRILDKSGGGANTWTPRNWGTLRDTRRDTSRGAWAKAGHRLRDVAPLVQEVLQGAPREVVQHEAQLAVGWGRRRSRLGRRGTHRTPSGQHLFRRFVGRLSPSSPPISTGEGGLPPLGG